MKMKGKFDDKRSYLWDFGIHFGIFIMLPTLWEDINGKSSTKENSFRQLKGSCDNNLMLFKCKCGFMRL